MSRFKLVAGLFVLAGLPLAFAITFVGLCYGYAHQHVHDITPEMQGTRAIVVVSDYHHSTGGIVAIAGVLMLAWVVITLFAALTGGGMISTRNTRWDNF